MRRDVCMCLVVGLCVLLLGSTLPRPFVTIAAARQQQQQQPRATELVVARVSVGSRQELERFAARGHDLLEMREGDDLFILASAEEVERLRGEGWRASVDERKTALLRSQRADLRQTRLQTAAPGADGLRAASYMGGYLTVPEMRAFVEDRAARYPNLAEVFVYGQSWQRLNQGPTAGHDLFGIRLTNKERTGSKPTFFLMAAIHARELSTSELALRFVDHLLTGYGTDADVTWLLDEHLVVVVPVVNPDGRRLAEQSLMQRKNMNDTLGGGCANPPDAFNQLGVDLNRNHDFKWGEVNGPDINPCDQVYPGTGPASEPETSTLQDYVRTLFPDRRGIEDTDAAPSDTMGVLISLHSYANLVMWPWGHTSLPAPNAAGLSLIGGKFAGYNGYTPQQANALYPSSGKTDEWAYGELGIPAYVFEVGIGEGECGGFMPPYRCLDEGYEGEFWPRNLPTFLYAARIARAPYQLAQGPTAESLAAIQSETAGVFELRAQLDERRNGGQRVAAAEYYLDAPPWQEGSMPVPMTAADGNFDATVEVATATVGPLTGTHTVYVRAQDEAGNWGPVRAVYSTDEACAYAVSPSAQTFAAAGGTGTINVTAGRGCGWAATVGGANWVGVASGGLGSGTTTLRYTVAPNGGTTARSTTLDIAGQTFNVTQNPAQVSAVALNPTSVFGGQNSAGTVTLDAPAPAGGATVALSSGDTSAANVPASVTVAAGATTQTFTVMTQPVASNTSVNVSAAYGGATRTAALNLMPAAAAPTNLLATAASSSRIDLKWTDNSTNESGFRIERCEGLTCSNFVQIDTVRSNTTTYRSSGLLSRRTYRYRVRAYNFNGNSVYSNIAAAQTK